MGTCGENIPKVCRVVSSNVSLGRVLRTHSLCWPRHNAIMAAGNKGDGSVGVERKVRVRCLSYPRRERRWEEESNDYPYCTAVNIDTVDGMGNWTLDPRYGTVPTCYICLAALLLNRVVTSMHFGCFCRRLCDGNMAVNIGMLSTLFCRKGRTPSSHVTHVRPKSPNSLPRRGDRTQVLIKKRNRKRTWMGASPRTPQRP